VIYQHIPVLAMRVRCLILSMMVAVTSSSTTSARDGLPDVRIAKFRGDRAAAVSYTFDDGLRDQYTLAVPMLNEVGFKGTFFIIPGHTSATPELGVQKQDTKRGWGGISWPELEEMAMQGHEIANDTWSHRSLARLSPEEVTAELTRSRDEITKRLGKPPLTLAFPFNQSTPAVRAAALESHAACRIYQTGVGGKSTAGSLDAWVDKQVRDRTWGVLMMHGIARGYAAFDDPEALRDHLRHVKSRERDIWVDTFANIARYEKERENVKPEVSGSIHDLAIILHSSLDARIFDIPLTVVVKAPGCTSARATCAGKELPTRISGDAIHLEATPSELPINLTWK
jgi:peptidoglycan/xylan/chitin deacetylase (PgdA/CDA1 family)